MTISEYIKKEARRFLNPFSSVGPVDNSPFVIFSFSLVAWWFLGMFFTAAMHGPGHVPQKEDFMFVPYILVYGSVLFSIFAYCGIKYKEFSGWTKDNVKNTVKIFLMLPITSSFFVCFFTFLCVRFLFYLISTGINYIADQISNL
jgi:hypothetical protein